MKYKPWPILKPGDIVEVIAPSAKGLTKDDLQKVHDCLSSWKLQPRIAGNIYGNDLLCANTDENRFEQLKRALLDTESKAVWCLRGGYGAARLLPALKAVNAPEQIKLFIGFSDITALHIFLQQQWQWQTLHGPSARQVAQAEIAIENNNELKDIIFGRKKIIEYQLLALNETAQENTELEGTITGGNLSVIQTSLATPWQINADNKILFLEEVNERGYRVDRILQHLSQAGIFKTVKAVLFGDFIGGTEPAGNSLVEPVLKRFAEVNNFPIFRCENIGHGKINRALPLGTNGKIKMEQEIKLMITIEH